MPLGVGVVRRRVAWQAADRLSSWKGGIPALPSLPMRSLLLASVSWLTLAPAAPAQVKVPRPPDTYDATIRYRIQADRNERVLQYEEMTKFFGKLGFKEAESEDSDLGPFDPTAE